MSAAEDLRAALVASAPLVALVGQRMRTDAAEQADAFPYVVFRRKTVQREFSLDNTLLAAREVFEIECWAERRLAAVEIEEAVVTALLAAGLVPDDNDPDALDPEVDLRCAIVNVSLWSTPAIT